MIDGKTIADLRIRLLTMRVAEARNKGTHAEKRGLLVESLFPATPDRMFYEIFSPTIGELLAMADGFQKLRRVREFCRDLQNNGKGSEHGQGFDLRRVLDALGAEVDALCAKIDVLCAEVERIFEEFEKLEETAAAVEDRESAPEEPGVRQP